MCIAIGKLPGRNLPTWEQFKNCFSHNSDGAGFAWAQDGQVYIKKGLMTYDEFESTLKAVMERVDLVNTGCLFHFRIQTHGGVNPGLTHPFPIHSDEGALNKTAYVSPYAVVHNGIIQLTSSEAHRVKNMSDTTVFIQKYISLIAQNENWFDNPANIELIEKLADSKIAILNGDGDIIMTKGFTEDGGIFWSNTSYKDGYTKTYGYTGIYNDEWYKRYFPNVGSKQYSYGTSYSSKYDTVSQSSATSTSSGKEYNATSSRLYKCHVGDKVESSEGLFEVEKAETFFYSEPGEAGFCAIYQRVTSETEFAEEYAQYFCDYEPVGVGYVTDKDGKAPQYRGSVFVYDDQFIGGSTPDVLFDTYSEEFEDLGYSEDDSTKDDGVEIVVTQDDSDIVSEDAGTVSTILENTNYTV